MNINKLPYTLKNYLNQVHDEVLIKNFLNDTTNPSKKVDFCIDLLQRDVKLDDLMKWGRLVKDDEKTENAFKRAMIEEQANNHENALILLNESLCFAPPKSAWMAKIYTNRSKIYYNMQLHEACLENITLALEHGAIDEQDLEIEKVRSKCLNAIKNGSITNVKDIKYKPDNNMLSFPAHPNIPFVSECIQLNMDKIYGRHLITNRDLNPGDVIMMEQPFASIINRSAIHKKCSYCLSYNFYNLIPCCDCTGTMFCSRQCYQLAVQKYHKYECRINETLQKWFNGESLVALRLVLLAINAFPDLNDLKNLSTAVNASVENQFTFNFDHADNNILFKTICSLTTVERERNPEDLFHKAQIAAIFYQLIKQDNELRLTIEDNNEHSDFIKELLYHFLQATTINTFPMWSQPEMTSVEKPNNTISDFGIATYPLSSFLSHSCAPNVRKARAGFNHEIMLIFVIRPVRAGEKICDCYDQQNNHLSRSLEERHATLHNQYYFICHCEACLHDYPTEENLQTKLKPYEWEQLKEAIDNNDNTSFLNHTDEQEATNFMKKFECLNTFLTDYDNYYPCTELIQAQKYLHESIKKLCTKPQFLYKPFSS